MTAATITVEKADEWDVEGWTSVPNALIRDKILDPDGKWAFSWLASHSKTFTFTAEDLAAAGPKGRNHARESIRKCEEQGWLTRRKAHDPITGRIVGVVYRLHPRPVSLEERTFVPSTAKKRAFPGKDAEENRRSDPAPDRAGAGKSGVTEPSENPRSDPAPDYPGAGESGAGRPGAGQVDVPYMDEKTTGEDQPRDPPTPRAAGGESPPAPEGRPVPVRCSEHGRAACRPCGLSPRAQERAAKEAEAAAGRAATEVQRACWRCNADGDVWVRGVVVTPKQRCDHVQDPELVAGDVQARLVAERAAQEEHERAQTGPGSIGVAERSAAASSAWEATRAKLAAKGRVHAP